MLNQCPNCKHWHEVDRKPMNVYQREQKSLEVLKRLNDVRFNRLKAKRLARQAPKSSETKDGSQ